MKEQKKERQRIWLIAAIIACMLLILVGALRYISSLRESLAEQSIANVMTVTTQQQQAFDTFISGDRERLYSFTEYIAQSRSDEVDEIQRKLTAYYSVDAYYVVVNLETGAFYGNKTGNSYQMNDEELEIYRSFSGSGVRNAYQTAYAEGTVFGYYECFTFADGVRGLFQKSYDSSRISREFSLSFYDGQGLAYIVDGQGDILLRSEGMMSGQTYENIFEVITGGSGDYAGREDIGAFMEALNNREMGSTVFVDGLDAFVYTYVPLESVEGWYLVSIVQRSAITERADQILLNSRNALLLLAAVLAVCCMISLLVWRLTRDLQGRDQELAYQAQVIRFFSSYLSSNMDDVYMMVDKATRRVDYISSNVERVLGISEERVRQDLNAFGMATYLSGSGVDGPMLSAMVSGTSLRPMETERINQQTGERKWFQESVYCTAINGRDKVLVYISDRTRERRDQDRLSEALKMAQAANTAKSTFLSSISHDIRTPMNAIMGLVTLLREEAGDNETVQEYVQRIDAASQHLLGLINDVLDINKIESGTATQNTVELRIPDIVDELNTIIRPQAKAKNQEFEIFVSDLTHENLMGDKLRINQILINILSNAVKYTPDGGRIQMLVEELPRAVGGHSRIRWTIKDNGMGMSEEYQKVIFEPFSRENTEMMHKIQGTGLGMAITKSLVDLLGGTITLKSKLGQGSTFIVEMELRLIDEDDDIRFWKVSGINRMLVADDEVDVCLDVVKVMAKTGVAIDYATDGRTAIEMARSARERGEPYDLLLLDWKMPDLDGMDTARLIRENYPERIPILLFTAYDWEEIEDEASSIGVRHFMHKPFFLSSFRDAIQRVMGGQKKTVKEEENSMEGMSFLVVDDIEVNRIILVKILQTMGAKCDTAENGQEALELFERSGPGEYDVILMDVQMPILDGYEATQAIRASAHPEAKSVAIIAMTANAFTDDIRKAIASGMDAHIAKPVQLDKLKSTIRQVMEQKRAEENS